MSSEQSGGKPAFLTLRHSKRPVHAKAQRRKDTQSGTLLRQSELNRSRAWFTIWFINASILKLRTDLALPDILAIL